MTDMTVYGPWTPLEASRPGAYDCVISGPLKAQLRRATGEVDDVYFPPGETAVSLDQYTAIRLVRATR